MVTFWQKPPRIFADDVLTKSIDPYSDPIFTCCFNQTYHVFIQYESNTSCIDIVYMDYIDPSLIVITFASIHPLNSCGQFSGDATDAWSAAD